jgi:hypothetical protein
MKPDTTSPMIDKMEVDKQQPQKEILSKTKKRVVYDSDSNEIDSQGKVPKYTSRWESDHGLYESCGESDEEETRCHLKKKVSHNITKYQYSSIFNRRSNHPKAWW